MRAAFISTLFELAKKDKRIILLTADLGYGVLDNFQKELPDQFVNVGVSEQNMIGIATGMAKNGFIPYCYSIVPFAVLRPYEFIRNGPVKHKLPVRIIGVGGGVEYGQNGFSHYGLEDIAVLRVQPGMTIVAPSDVFQAKAALLATSAYLSPVYYRLGKNETSTLPSSTSFEPIKLISECTDKRGPLVISMGAIAVDVQKVIDEAAIACKHVCLQRVCPEPYDELSALISKHSRVVTVEAHYIKGGLFSIVSETLARNFGGAEIPELGAVAVSRIPETTGSQEFVQRQLGISSRSIINAIEGTK